MRAYSTQGLEIKIDLTEEEIAKIPRQTIKGLIKVRKDREGNCFPLRELEICLGATENLFIDLKCLPQGCCFETTEKYRITISEEGYHELRKYGDLCDRTGWSSRVDIRKVEHIHR